MTRHLHLEAVVEAEFQRIHELRDDEQAAAVVGQTIGHGEIERREVEAPAVIFDLGQQVVVAKRSEISMSRSLPLWRMALVAASSTQSTMSSMTAGSVQYWRR